MRYYYYALCTRDFSFENIFATESVSPFNFYSLRGFGIDYFFKMPLIHHEKGIVLFNAPPKFELPPGSGDSVKFILAIEEDSLDTKDIFIIKEGIICYKKSIYLNKNNFKILFFSERDKKITCLKAETSLPTKGLKKYEDNFSIVLESDCVSFDTNNIENLSLDNDAPSKEIEYDRKYNFFKGFIYGIAVGLICAKSKGEIKIKRSFQEIANCFAELKNRSENLETKTENKYSQLSSSVPFISLEGYNKKVKNAIQNAERIFIELFPEEAFSEDKLINYLQEKFSDRLKSLEDAKKYLDYVFLDEQIFEDSKYSKLKSFYKRNAQPENHVNHFEILRDQSEQFFKNSRYNSVLSKSNRQNSNEKFKQSLFDLGKFVDVNILKKLPSNNVDLYMIHFSYDKNEVTFNDNFHFLNKESIEELSLIINCVLNNTKFGRGEASKEKILALVEQVGNIFSKSKDAKSSQLYQYLSNVTNTYSIEKVSSVIMKNFVAFVFNPDSVEKLENFLEAKEIEQKWIAHALWGAFNGFANTSKNFVKPIFETDNVSLQQKIDDYLRTTFLNVSQSNIDLSRHDFEKIIFPDTESSELNALSSSLKKDRDFFDKYIAGKYTLTFDEFHAIIKLEDSKQSIKELEMKHNIPKKNGKKIVQSYKEFITSSILF